MTTLRIGQVWADNDKRSEGRTQEGCNGEAVIRNLERPGALQPDHATRARWAEFNAAHWDTNPKERERLRAYAAEQRLLALSLAAPTAPGAEEN